MIPYNPSSFNSNKTILEQILELKNWLKDHPQYEVYYCNDNASLYPFMNTFNLADVPDNTNMDVGDLVVCNNAVYCTVISIDRDNGVFTAGYGVSFKGDTGAAGQQGYSLRVSSENYVDDVTAYHRNSLEPSHGTRENDTILFANGYVGIVTSLGAGATYYVTNRTVSFVGPQGPQGPTGATGPQGPTGPTGADGNDGVSITNVAIDGNSHLIVTLSDGSTIDAGSVSSGGLVELEITYSQIGSALSDAEYTQVQNADIVIVNYGGGDLLEYTRDSESSTEIKFARTYGSGIDAIVVNKSTKVVTNPTTTISSFPELVSVNGSNGTLSQENYNKLLNGALIKRTNNSVIYQLASETGSELVYTANIWNSSNSYTSSYYIRVVKSTRSWQYYTGNVISYATKDNIVSTGATNGQVLTADGNGNSSWQTPSGSEPEIVTITGTSGRFVGDNLTAVLSENCIIYHSGDNRYYRKGTPSSSSSVYYYETSYNNSSIAYANSIEIIKNSGNWTKSSGMIRFKPIASTIDSQTATNGQVLTADGNGGADWQTPSGGSGKYAHYVKFNNFSNYELSCILITDDASPYTYDNIFSKITSNFSGYKLPVSGYYKVSSNIVIATHIDVASTWGTSYINGINNSFTNNNSNCNTVLSTPNEIYDKVITL